MLTDINAFDLSTLERLRLERLSDVCGDKKGYKFKLEGGQLYMEAISPFWIDVAIRGFQFLMEVAYNILGVESIKLIYANKSIADYHRVNSVGIKKSMVATLEREETTAVNNVQTASPATSTQQQNSDYISLDQLRAMAVEISGENEEFIAWMEQTNVTIPTKFVAGTPRYQTKAIFKAATDWNNSKIQMAMSRYLGVGVSANPQPSSNETSANGTQAPSTPASKLKLLRTPSGFKPIKSGKDKYIKTVKALIAALPSDKVGEYQRHILDQDEMGTAFVTRLSKQFDEKDAFAKLIEAFLEDATAYEGAAA